MKNWLLFSFLILMKLNVFAQTPTPSITKTPVEEKNNSEKIVNNDYLIFELEMAENGYTINKDILSTTRLLRIYEKVVFQRCLYEAYYTLAHSTKTKDKICLSFIDKIFDIDPGNIVAFCAKDGNDSQTCKTASLKQTISTYDPRRDEKENKASLDEVIAERREGPQIKEKTDELLDKLRLLNIPGNKKKNNPAAEKKAILLEILNLNCQRPRIKLEKLYVKEEVRKDTSGSLIAPDSLINDKKQELSEATKTTDPFSQMLNEHFSTPTPVVVLPKSHREYQVSIICNEYIEDALSFDSNFSAALCYRWGFYSWQCINARRNEKLHSRGGSDSFTSPTGDIQKF